MGVSSLPRTVRQVERLEARMRRPLPAAEAGAALRGVLEDDNLSDMVAAVRARDPARDVRVLVAMSLDELVNWSDPGGVSAPRRRERGAHNWPEALRERCAILAWAFREEEAPLDCAPGGGVGADAAVAKVSACVPGAASDPARFEARPGTGPGSHVVADAATGEAFRVDAFYGVVIQAPGAMRDEILRITAPADRVPGGAGA